MGIPIASSRDIKAAAEEIIEKVKQRLQGWKMKSLSQAGRATLITSVASSIPAYQASSLISKLHWYKCLKQEGEVPGHSNSIW